MDEAFRKFIENATADMGSPDPAPDLSVDPEDAREEEREWIRQAAIKSIRDAQQIVEEAFGVHTDALLRSNTLSILFVVLFDQYRRRPIPPLVGMSSPMPEFSPSDFPMPEFVMPSSQYGSASGSSDGIIYASEPCPHLYNPKFAKAKRAWTVRCRVTGQPCDKSSSMRSITYKSCCEHWQMAFVAHRQKAEEKS